MANRWGARALKDRCETLRDSCRHARVAAEAEMDQYAPGGSDNRETGTGAWIVYYANLLRLYGRSEPQRQQAALDAALARQLAAAPVTVPLTDGTARAVYPKSYHALRFLDTLDRELTLVMDRAAQANITASDGAVVAMLSPLVESLAVRLWAWVLAHPEPGLPFDDAGEAPVPPPWTQALTARDVLAMARAHAQVNHQDLALIAQAFPSDSAKPDSRLTLAGFLGTAADAMGQRPFDVMRRWSLGELFAQRVAAAEAHRAASAKPAGEVEAHFAGAA